MSIRKILSITILFFGLYLWTSFGQQEHFVPNYCDSVWFILQWPKVSLKDVSQEYSIGITFSDTGFSQLFDQDVMVIPNEILEDASIRWELILGDENVLSSRDKSISYIFDSYWNYTLRVMIQYEWCTRTIEQSIWVYEEIYTYVWPFIQDFNYGILTNIRQINKLFHTYIPDTQTFSQPEKFLTNILNQESVVAQSAGIFFSTNQYALVFDSIHRLQGLWIDFNNVPIFLIDDWNKTIVTKFLVRFMKEYDIETIHIIDSEEFVAMLLSLSVGKEPYNLDDLDALSVRIGDVSSYFSLGWVVDYLLFYGFPLDTLVILLSIVMAIVFIVFCKQVIWLSSFGVYYPIFFALSLHTIWLKTSFALLLLAILTKITIIFLIRKYTILATAKLGFQLFIYIVYIILWLVIYSMVFGSQWVEYTIFTNPMILVAIVTILLVWTKVWTLSSLKITKTQLWNLIWFVVLSVISYFIINSLVLHTFILLYPLVIVLWAIIIVILGRYTWLQFVEYIRFWPLIRHLRKK